MKIIELVLDDNEESGIEAISIVESPAIESDFIALKSDQVKLAEVDLEKKILMGPLLIPNKPIYRKTEGDEYYIYFSKETVLKASQRYLTNGYQSNSTLEHSDNLQGLTLVESWIVEDDKFDKSRKYNLNAPVGTWMGTIKVNNDKIWNDYVKTGKVKGFSIEGFFADKIEAQKMYKQEKQADLLLSKIAEIVKGEKTELSLASDLQEFAKIIKNEEGNADDVISDISEQIDRYNDVIKDLKEEIKLANSSIDQIDANKYRETLDKADRQAKDLGINPTDIKGYTDLSKNLSKAEVKSDDLKDIVEKAENLIK